MPKKMNDFRVILAFKIRRANFHLFISLLPLASFATLFKRFSYRKWRFFYYFLFKLLWQHNKNFFSSAPELRLLFRLCLHCFVRKLFPLCQKNGIQTLAFFHVLALHFCKYFPFSSKREKHEMKGNLFLKLALAYFERI